MSETGGRDQMYISSYIANKQKQWGYLPSILGLQLINGEECSLSECFGTYRLPFLPPVVVIELLQAGAQSN